MQVKKVLITSIVVSAALLSCKKETKKQVETNKVEEKVPGIVLENMDTSVKPSEDFYRYVNGKWQDKTEIPSDRTSWGSFAELRKKTDTDVLAILDDAIKNKTYKAGSDQEKAVNYYESIMNVDGRNKQGLEPLKPYLAKVDAIKTKADVEKYISESANNGIGNPFFGFGVYNDLKDSKMNAGYLGSGGLGLSRDYYVDQDADTQEKRKKYELFVATLLQKYGQTGTVAKKDAAIILQFETSLAKPRMTKEERRDSRKRYNPMSVAELSKIASAVNWNAYFKALGVAPERIIVSDPKYIKAMNNVFKTTSVNDIKTLLRWGIINSTAGLLTTDLEKTKWEFYSKTLRGAKQQRPRNERALASVNGAIGEALGQLYVDKKFPPEAKKKAQEMITNVRLGFKKRIAQLSWMSEGTKKKAVEKLNKLTVKIAYPDKWKDYSKLAIKSVKEGGSYFENVMNVKKWAHHKNIAKLGKPVDRTEWGMSPQTVNAYFNSVNNEIVFPAAILQPPFYNYTADEAVNYGGIGAVIGHEISHSFDDSGARFDGDGNLNNWWTEQDAKEFKKAGKMLIDQFSDLVAVDDVHVNGEFTLGENIGDLGGIQASFEGFKIFLENQKQKSAKIDGFTPEQRFFLSWATVWRTKMRDEAIKNRVKTDPHSPGFFRAYVPLKNVDAFYEAFDIKEGDKMYLKPEERVRIW